MMCVDEKVLTVRRSLLEHELLRQPFGLIRERKDAIYQTIIGNAEFRSRGLVEGDPNQKQIIPYVLLRHDAHCLLLRRTSKQGEKRLHDKYSLGIGGHINHEDGPSGRDPVRNGLQRELHEEVDLHTSACPKFIGFINDDRSEVGKVHLGLLFELTCGDRSATVRERDKMTGCWSSFEEIRSVYETMETWSQIVFSEYLLAI